jgi:hypothetical protein
MNAGSMRTVTGFDGAAVCFGSPVSRQQGRVEVDHFSHEGLQNLRTDDAHKPCQHNQVRFAGGYEHCQRTVKIVPVGKPPVFENAGGYTGVFSPDQAFCVRYVTDDVVYFDIQFAGPAGIDQGLQVAAGARDQDACFQWAGHVR